MNATRVGVTRRFRVHTHQRDTFTRELIDVWGFSTANVVQLWYAEIAEANIIDQDV